MTSYDTMLLETKQSASLYTLDILSPRSTASETLKPVIPPFLPSPSFGLDNSDSSHRFTPNFRAYKGEDNYVRPNDGVMIIKNLC